MKKLVLLTAAVALILCSVKAQQYGGDYREKLLVGAKIGFNISNVYDSQGATYNADSKFGFVTGGFMSIPIGPFLGIQPEVLFSQKGFRATGAVGSSVYEFTRTSNFLDIPVFVVLKPSRLLSLMVGPQFSYLMKQSDVYANSTLQQDFNNDNIRKNILCFIGGLDINVNHIVLSARAGWDVQNNNGDGTSSTPRYKNVWYQATFGLRF